MADEYEWAIISTSYTETFPVEVDRRRLNELKRKAAALDAILASWGMTWEQYQGRRTDTQVLPVDEQMQPRGTDAVAEFTAADYLQTGTGEACSDG